MSGADALTEAKSICVTCGLCCDGTLFVSVPVKEGDLAAPLEAAGIVLREGTSGTSFAQPCPALQSGRCTAYESRPAVCRAYRCRLLRRVEDEAQDPADACEAIARAVALGRRVRAALERLEGQAALPTPRTRGEQGGTAAPGFGGPPEALVGLFATVADRIEGADNPVAARREHAGLLLDMGALQMLLERHFKLPRETAGDGGGPGAPVCGPGRAQEG